MFNRFTMVLLVAIAPVVVFGQTTILSEDFESGLGAWTVVKGQILFPDPALTFDGATGLGSDGTTQLFGPRMPYVGQEVSQCAGYSVEPVEWDGDVGEWLQKQWAVAPGEYNVTVEMDLYLYYGDIGGDPWGAGNRIYVLTDDQFNNPAWDYHDAPASGAGFRKDFWPGEPWVYDPVEDGDVPTWQNNGAWQHVTLVPRDDNDDPTTLTTATGNIELRLLMQKKHNWQSAATWDNVHVTITPAAGGAPVVSFVADFETGLGGFTPSVFDPPNNDTPMTFTSTDPLLYANQNNPGSTSAGYSSNMDPYDGTAGEWIQRQFPNAVPADPTNGTTYDVTLAFDRYVYRETFPDNDTPLLFPANGAGIYGANTGHNGTQTAGFSSNLVSADGNSEWLRQLFPSATTGLTPGTYAVRLELDLYLYKDSEDGGSLGNRLLVLTDDQYDNPDYDFNDDAAPGFRKSYWLNTDWSKNGVWQHVVLDRTITTATGDFEILLVCNDSQPGPQTVAWDNVKLRVGSTDLIVNETFESGLGNWTAMVTDPPRQPQDYGVGNRVYVLTDDRYNDRTWDWDNGNPSPGFAQMYWPNVPDWSNNGVWVHEVLNQRITTRTGNVELRLLCHDKFDGKQAVAWDNVTLTLTYVPPRCGNLRFDTDKDGDVDQVDFAVFQSCYTGDGVAITNATVCGCMDSDFSTAEGAVNDVDQIDLQAFEACASAPGVTADAACDDAYPNPPDLPLSGL
jgi:hypothetical protein